MKQHFSPFTFYPLPYFLTGGTVFLMFFLIISAISPPSVQDNSLGDLPQHPVLYTSPGSVEIIRDDSLYALGNGDKLYPGDAIKTGSNQFVAIHFPSGSMLFLHPLSHIKMDSIPGIIHLISADILEESAPGISEKFHTITCFDGIISIPERNRSQTRIGVQCRGQSGVTVSAIEGFLNFDVRGQHYKISPGQAISGQSESSHFVFSEIPDQPELIGPIRVAVAEQADTPYSRQFQWNNVPMADQYMIHISGSNTDSLRHQLNITGKNKVSVDHLPPGNYTIRVAAFDYYGVMGKWSDPVPYEVYSD